MTKKRKKGYSFIFISGKNRYVIDLQGNILDSEIRFRTSGVLEPFSLSEVHQLMQEAGQHRWNLEVSVEPGVVSCDQNGHPTILQGLVEKGTPL